MTLSALCPKSLRVRSEFEKFLTLGRLDWTATVQGIRTGTTIHR
jgi:hypothetical protein